MGKIFRQKREEWSFRRRLLFQTGEICSPSPFAHRLLFALLQQPPKPERNFFRKGQKLEAVDPKHPQYICPATVNSVSPGDYRIVITLDGWSSSNNFKVDYYCRDIFPVGWCQAAGVRLCPIGGNRQ